MLRVFSFKNAVPHTPWLPEHLFLLSGQQYIQQVGMMYSSKTLWTSITATARSRIPKSGICSSLSLNPRATALPAARSNGTILP